ncbi:putative endoglucanase [Sodiomyces alkalinus F11]|uniref:Putative endoglucanase n=1 Tax=Sodiomyces alkalinus (strain CBS 110278 / VKM F-3762 / F11) TaxID=1314773 RepID=A0A3N2Q7N6_SODAK|nr:putative endoglucanase [Sodiomyces alkalinus F11]ROT42791.1 putative endoglucanase [Sodiomyces alkalinus F11]
MEMTWPPPFRSRHNPFTTDIDYSMTNPLSSSGSDFPCKGYHRLLDTAQGGSVVEWEAGQSYGLTLGGSATHNGGSCQASLSYDRGQTWTVIHSYIGNCPLKPTWEFSLPHDTPSGSALFAWSWFNNIGNREMYMNCAHVTISGYESAAEIQERARPPGAPFYGRPALFVANVGNGCSTLEGADVEFPQPGPDVDYATSRSAPPQGSCGAFSALKKRSAKVFRA